MKSSVKLLLGGLAAALFSLTVAAQPGPGMQGMAGMGPQTSGACAKARDPQRCEALLAAKEACKDKSAAEKRKCIEDAMPPIDCSKALRPDRCEAAEKARLACKDKNGAEHRQCIREHMPKRGGQPPAPKN